MASFSALQYLLRLMEANSLLEDALRFVAVCHHVVSLTR
jgi:hypothetical protein